VDLFQDGRQRAGKVLPGDRIGGDYSRERIMERLAEPEEKRCGKAVPAGAAGQGGAAAPASAAAPPGGRQPPSASYGQKTDWQARRAKLAATKELAAALLTVREEDVRQEGDFDIRVDLLLEKAGSLRSAMAGLADRNRQHRDVAKYLLAYREYLPVRQAAERLSPSRKKRFLSGHGSELLAFGHAAAQLERLGVSTDADPGEMVALVKDQDGRISGLAAAFQEASGRISRLRKARELVEGRKKKPETGQERSDAR
jgi:hypothetical protein